MILILSINNSNVSLIQIVKNTNPTGLYLSQILLLKNFWNHILQIDNKKNKINCN
jgi:hypothetical protein